MAGIEQMEWIVGVGDDTGTEWLIDAKGCNSAALTNKRRLSQLLRAVIKSMGLHVVGVTHWHRFPKTGGLTGFIILKESHISCHTYPESGRAAFNIYVCRSRRPFPWRQALRDLFDAQTTRVRRLVRGGL